jgi:hypothetical protein
LLVLGLIGAGLVGLFCWHVTRDPEALEVRVEAPVSVARGDSCELVVTVVNRRPKELLRVTTIE